MMTIENGDVVDLIGMDRATGAVTLRITDHLDWSEEDIHLMLLQDKLNTYLRFIESGEIYEAYPHAVGRRVSIEVVGMYPLTAEATNFMANAKDSISDEGIDLSFRLLID